MLRLGAFLRDPSPPLGAAAATSGSRFAAWVVGLRWVAVLFVTVAVWVAVQLRVVVPGAVPRLIAGASLLFAINASFSFVAADRLASPRALMAQIGCDVAVLGWLVHHAGGVTNPFSVFFVFHAVIAAIVLSPSRARRSAAAISASVLALAVLEATGVLTPMPARWISSAPAALCAAGAAIGVLSTGVAVIVAAVVGAVELERDKLRSIIECMADAVLFVDPRGNILLRNRAAAQLWSGRPPSGDLRVCHDPTRWSVLLDRLANPSPQEEHPILAVGGRSYEGTYASVRDDRGALNGVVMVARDVTERIEAQAGRMREQRMAVIGKLAAGLAHEINNPLASIALFTRQALKRLPEQSPLAEHLGTVLRNADHCKRIVKDLLEYARQRPPSPGVVSPRTLVGDVVRTLQPQAARAGVEIVTALDEQAAIAGDSDQLRQVLVNLGLNGIEAMPHGGKLRLEVKGGDEVRIEVADDGVGVPPEDRDRIFSAFYTTKPDGTGLGLSVVRDLVDAHGGRVEVDSAPGRGSRFSIVLPPRRARA